MKPLSKTEPVAHERAPSRQAAGHAHRGSFERLLERRRESVRNEVDAAVTCSAAMYPGELCVQPSAWLNQDDGGERQRQGAPPMPPADDEAGAPARAEQPTAVDRGTSAARARPLVAAVRALSQRSVAAAGATSARYRLRFVTGALAGLSVTLTRIAGPRPALQVEIDAGAAMRLGPGSTDLLTHLQHAAGCEWQVELRVAGDIGRGRDAS